MSTTVSHTATATLALLSLKGVGRKAVLRVLENAGRHVDRDTLRDVVAARGRLARLPALTYRELSDAWSRSEEQICQGMDIGVTALSYHDETYPQALRETPDPPAILFVKGDMGGLHASGRVAIVGTREPTEYGAEVAVRSGRSAAQSGFVVVSGLAHGCDTAAHAGCLEATGVGIAVMAHGLERVYPAKNRDLAERLLASGGCLVSEYPVGAAPIRAAFAERDRIQSGLSQGVLVVETDVQGGTMHTVRFARSQNRTLACIDHPEKWKSHEKTQGNQRLIADGWAVPIADGQALADFLCALSLPYSVLPLPIASAHVPDSQPALAL